MRKQPSSANAFPENLLATLSARHRIRKKTRNFFDERGYLEVETPIRVPCPGLDPYIDAFPAGKGFYLATSPELQMKRLLRTGAERIYQITRSFRAEEQGSLHSVEFSMLEWYRTGATYWDIMDETEELMRFLENERGQESPRWRFPFLRMTVDQTYREAAGWEPSRNWDEDRYYRDWVEKIDPFLVGLSAVFLYDFPAPLAALAKIKDEHTLVCERFELFINGIELANAFTELTDYNEHMLRFETAAVKRQELGKELYPFDKLFLQSVRDGIPECGGIAVGFDRLVMAISGEPCIERVQTFPLSRL